MAADGGMNELAVNVDDVCDECECGDDSPTTMHVCVECARKTCSACWMATIDRAVRDTNCAVRPRCASCWRELTRCEIAAACGSIYVATTYDRRMVYETKSRYAHALREGWYERARRRNRAKRAACMAKVVRMRSDVIDALVECNRALVDDGIARVDAADADDEFTRTMRSTLANVGDAIAAKFAWADVDEDAPRVRVPCQRCVNNGLGCFRWTRLGTCDCEECGAAYCATCHVIVNDTTENRYGSGGPSSWRHDCAAADLDAVRAESRTHGACPLCAAWTELRFVRDDDGIAAAAAFPRQIGHVPCAACGAIAFWMESADVVAGAIYDPIDDLADEFLTDPVYASYPTIANVATVVNAATPADVDGNDDDGYRVDDRALVELARSLIAMIDLVRRRRAAIGAIFEEMRLLVDDQASLTTWTVHSMDDFAHVMLTFAENVKYIRDCDRVHVAHIRRVDDAIGASRERGTTECVAVSKAILARSNAALKRVADAYPRATHAVAFDDATLRYRVDEIRRFVEPAFFASTRGITLATLVRRVLNV